MHAERQLLNNPPPSGALPSTVEQWRHDVDQLIIMSINMPPLGLNHQPPAGHSCTPTPPQAPPPLHALARLQLAMKAEGHRLHLPPRWNTNQASPGLQVHSVGKGCEDRFGWITVGKCWEPWRPWFEGWVEETLDQGGRWTVLGGRRGRGGQQRWREDALALTHVPFGNTET
jgi:hypothetical protein